MCCLTNALHSYPALWFQHVYFLIGAASEKSAPTLGRGEGIELCFTILSNISNFCVGVGEVHIPDYTLVDEQNKA